ncbi:hypothetical protein [Nocardia sp. NPDC050412]
MPGIGAELATTAYTATVAGKVRFWLLSLAPSAGLRSEYVAVEPI